MSLEHQDLLDAELMERVRLLALLPTRLSPEERAELEADVAAMYAGHGL